VSSLTPAERTLRARLAAHAGHAQGKTNTEPARKAFKERFLDEVDPDRVLPEAERLRRAEHAYKAHMARLSLKAAQARRRAAS
jgi:hypothetical protein